jgi:hypothetical protein
MARTCPKCYAKCPEADKFCGKCGSELEIADFNVSVMPHPPTKRGKPAKDFPIDTDSESSKQLIKSFIKRSEKCPHCGYPNAKGNTICVNCHKNLNKSSGRNIRRRENAPIQAPSNNSNGGEITISPYARHKCKLISIPEKGEEKIQDIVLEALKTTNVISLNRNNTDPGNNTISRSLHAIIKYADGKWTIIDKSINHNTFLQLNEPHTLKNGDVIILGDRRFKFVELS